MKPKILIVDDEKNIRRTLSMILKSAGYAVREAESGEAGVTALEEEPANAVLLDVGLPGQSGLVTLKQIRDAFPETAVIMISGQATVAVAVEATQLGAFDFLEKPLSKDRVLIALRNALQLSTLDRKVARLDEVEVDRRAIIGESAPIESLRTQVQKVGPTNATVLITGESGSGKELIARLVHDSSPRAGGAFIKVNCAAIPEELIETELFGCVKGAYTGADRSRDGKFMAADGGTLFLDEIGDMSLKVQAKVLRALQEREIERVGDTKTIKVNVRVIAATNKDLLAESEAGNFREDLYYRLAVVPLSVPPLRERRDDVPALSRHFLRLYAAENDLPVKEISSEAMATLQSAEWRGNIRELRNVTERLAILCDGPRIGVDDVSILALQPGATRSAGSAQSAGSWNQPSVSDIQAAGGLVKARREFERTCIVTALEASDGNVSQAARLLGVERSNLHKKMQSLGLDGSSARETQE